MSQQFDLFTFSPTDSTGDDAGTDPAAAASGPALMMELIFLPLRQWPLSPL